MRRYSDEELRDWLLYYGYAVPLIAIRTWGRFHDHHTPNRRTLTERWLNFKNREKFARMSPWPQHLELFDLKYITREKWERSQRQKFVDLNSVQKKEPSSATTESARSTASSASPGQNLPRSVSK